MLSNYHVEKAARDQRRNRDLNVEKHLRREEAKFLDREQRRQERAERWKLEKKERERRLVLSSCREGVLLGMTVLSVICALGFLFVAISSGGAYAIGGSGLTGFSSIWGMVSLTLRQSAPLPMAISPPE